MTCRSKYLFFLQAVPSRTTWRRPLMVRHPYSEAVLSTGGRFHPLPFWKGRGLGSGLRTLPLGRSKWGKNYCFPESSARFRLIPSFSEFPSVEARWLLILAHQKAPLTEGGELWLAFLFPYLPHAPFPKPYL